MALDVRDFLERYRCTFARTLEVCEAIPEDKWDWRPAEGMRRFRELVGAIVGTELVMIRGILYDEWPSTEWRQDFSTRKEAMDFFRRLHQDAAAEFSRLHPEAFHRKVASPLGEVSRLQLAVRMLERAVNERGSLYVYLRLAGAEIPPRSEKR